MVSRNLTLMRNLEKVRRLALAVQEYHDRHRHKQQQQQQQLSHKDERLVRRLLTVVPQLLLPDFGSEDGGC